MTEEELQRIEQGDPTSAGEIAAALTLFVCLIVMIGYVISLVV